MKCTKCGSREVELEHHDRSAIVRCEVCGRETLHDKVIIGRKSVSVYLRSGELRKGTYFLIESKGSLIEKGVIVMSMMLENGFAYFGSKLEFEVGSGDGKQVGTLYSLLC